MSHRTLCETSLLLITHFDSLSHSCILLSESQFVLDFPAGSKAAARGKQSATVLTGHIWRAATRSADICSVQGPRSVLGHHCQYAKAESGGAGYRP